MSYSEKELFNIFVTLENGEELIYNNSKIIQPLDRSTAVIEVWENNKLASVRALTGVNEIVCKPLLENLNEVI